MDESISVGVIGDFDSSSPTHAATEKSLRDAAAYLGTSAEVSWLSTESLRNSPESCRGFDALWAAPGTVESLDGALEGIRYAREENVPFIGTCGGFQNAVVEFARNVVGVEEADHAEHAPSSGDLFVSPLACSLVGAKSCVVISSGSMVERFHRMREVEEEYRCNYGITPERLSMLEDAGLHVTGVDENGEPRIIEIPDHKFYVSTLFVPQSGSSKEEPHPLVIAVIRAAVEREV